MSMAPRLASTRATSPGMPSMSARSCSKNAPRAPVATISSTTLGSFRRPTAATSAPAAARPTAIARPRPRLLPVTSATLPFKLNRSFISNPSGVRCRLQPEDHLDDVAALEQVLEHGRGRVRRRLGEQQVEIDALALQHVDRDLEVAALVDADAEDRQFLELDLQQVDFRRLLVR